VTLPIAGPGTYPFGAFCGGVTFTDTNGVTVITATFVYSYPSVNGAGLPRQYTLAANGSGFQAAVTLCYDDHDLLNAGISDPETALHAYHYTGSGWTQHSRVDPVNNLVTIDGLTDMGGVWGLGVDSDAPSAIEPRGVTTGQRIPAPLLALLGSVAAALCILRKRK